MNGKTRLNAHWFCYSPPEKKCLLSTILTCVSTHNLREQRHKGLFQMTKDVSSTLAILSFFQGFQSFHSSGGEFSLLSSVNEAVTQEREEWTSPEGPRLFSMQISRDSD